MDRSQRRRRPVRLFQIETLAEKLAWEMAGDPARNPRAAPLATISPGFILGPSLVPWARYSLQTIKGMIERKLPFSLDMTGHFVDVRDCAAMHVAVMDKPETVGRRHFCFSMVGKMVETPCLIRELYGARGLNPSTFVIPTWLLFLMKPFNSDIGAIYGKLGHANVYETTWPDVYAYRYTDPRASIRDTIDSMAAHGWITLMP